MTGSIDDQYELFRSEEEERALPRDIDEAFALSGEPPEERGTDRNHDFRPIIERIARSRNTPMSAFTDFVQMCACALSMQTREEEYLSVAKNYSREELSEFSKALAYLVAEMESKPFTDVLGPFYLEIGSKFSRDLRGEFYTPKSVGDAIGKMLIDVEAVVKEGRAITVGDPAGGSGGLILSLAAEFAKHGAVDLLRVTCQDISRTACDMAYINTTLWAIPAKIVQGDTLRMTVENIWINLHWARVGEPMREKIMAIEELIRPPPPDEHAKPDDPPKPAPNIGSSESSQGMLFE